MDQLTSRIVRAVESGATTIKGVIEATGYSRLKVERTLGALEKQKLIIRDGNGFKGTRAPATPARHCGTCTQCCTLLEVADAGKTVNEWCQHCEAGKGCRIYDDRPQMCRSFNCAWIQGHLGDEWFPETAGMVVHFSQDAVNVQVDPKWPDRWRQEPYFSKLREWSLNGLRANGSPGYATLIAVGAADKFLLLGRTIVPEPTPFGTAFIPVTSDAFRYWKATSPEHLQRLNDRIAEIHRIRKQFGRCTIPDDDDPYPPYRPALLRLSNIAHDEPA